MLRSVTANTRQQQEPTMQKDDNARTTQKPQTSSPDKLVEDGKKAGVELTEQDLDKISGGPTAVEYYKI
jgi:hypothetical protein